MCVRSYHLLILFWLPGLLDFSGYVAVVRSTGAFFCTDTSEWVDFENPTLNFASTPSSTQIYSAVSVTTEAVWFLDAVTLEGHSSSCTGEKDGGRVVIGIDHGNDNITYYQHDRRLQLVENTPTSPADVDSDNQMGGRYGTCPSVPRTLLNEDTCVRRDASSCNEPSYSSVDVTLNHSTLRSWYDLSSKLVYTARNLRMETNSLTRYPGQ